MVQNRPGETQRLQLVDRGTSVRVQARLVILHGTLSPGGDPGTIITIEFRFLSLKVSQRARSASIKLRFADLESTSEFDPEVVGISPEGQFRIVS